MQNRKIGVKGPEGSGWTKADVYQQFAGDGYLKHGPACASGHQQLREKSQHSPAAGACTPLSHQHPCSFQKKGKK